MRGRRLAVAAGLLIFALVVLTGCGASGADSGEAGGAGEGVAEEAAADQATSGDGGAAPAAVPEAEGGDEVMREVRGALVDPRHIIYTGSITIQVPDVDEGARAAAALAERHGGFVGGDRRTTSEDAPPEATLVLRIPSEDFMTAVNELGELGQEESRELQTEDVTQEVVDLEAQIETADASVDRTRALLDRAESIDDIVRIEEELSEREAILGSLQARQRTLANLTALSTITATLVGPDPTPQTEEGGFLAGVAGGWRAFTASLEVALTVLGALLPWLVALGVPAAAVMWWVRRRRAVPPAPAAPEATGSHSP